MLAIDDAQWVDAPSAEVLEFVMRRLGEAPVAIVASGGSPPRPRHRRGRAAGVRPEQALGRPIARLEVGPLSLGAIHRLLRTRTAAAFNRPMLQRIHETSGGNPFYALELARALEAGSAGSEPLTLTSGLNELLAVRLTGLADRTRAALFVAAALTQPTLDLVAGATGFRPDATEADLAPAVRASIIRVIDGTIEFAHPLLAAAAYAALDPSERRHWHARIARTAEDTETGRATSRSLDRGPTPASRHSSGTPRARP